MKTKLYSIIAALSFFFLLPSAFAQGSLTPPGPPGPTMVTLSQIEPRTPISSAPFTISSTAASATGFGILINSGLRNLTIENGFIQGTVTNNGSGVYNGGGFSHGIYSFGTLPANVLVFKISAAGLMGYGIYLANGDSTVVESCTVRTVGAFGIYASIVKDCSAIDCGNIGIYCDQVSDSRGQCSGSGEGIYATGMAHNSYGYCATGIGLLSLNAQNCQGRSGGSGNGIQAGYAQNCYGYSPSGYGISATTALNCEGDSNGSYGIDAYYVAQNCYGSSSSGYGLSTANAQNCFGLSNSGSGLFAGTAQNSYGTSTSGIGISASAAENCYGQSSTTNGITANSALNCNGYSNGSGYGIYASSTATGCYGYSYSGTGVYALIANVCHGATSTGTALTATHNVNSF